MVKEIPGTFIGTRYGDEPISSLEPEHVGAFVVESIKGDKDVPVLIRNERELYREFKTTNAPFYACGGKVAWVTSARAGTPVKALSKLYDNAGTPVNVGDLEAKRQGDYEILVTIEGTAEYNTVRIYEAGYNVETWKDYGTIENLFTRIDAQSKLVNATFKGEGSGTLASLAEFKLGSGDEDTDGSNGTTKVGTTDGTLADLDAPTAHQTALAQIALVNNPLPGVVFCNREDALVKAKYAAHAVATEDVRVAKWRNVLVGTAEGDSYTERIAESNSYDEECIGVVAMGLYDSVGNYYKPCELTSAVAGLLCSLDYNVPIFGGERTKILGLNGVPFFAKLGEQLSYDEYVRLNEGGCITFKQRKYGIGLTESVTSATEQTSETDSDQMSVVRIKHKALRAVYDALEKREGILMTDTFNDDTIQAVKAALEPLKTEKALSDDTRLGYPAYSVEINAIPDDEYVDGETRCRIGLHPTPTSRQIFVDLITR